jgi:hypothetical protein
MDRQVPQPRRRRPEDLGLAADHFSKAAQDRRAPLETDQGIVGTHLEGTSQIVRADAHQGGGVGAKGSARRIVRQRPAHEQVVAGNREPF